MIWCVVVETKSARRTCVLAADTQMEAEQRAMKETKGRIVKSYSLGVGDVPCEDS